MNTKEIKTATSKEVLAEIKLHKNLREYTLNKVYADISEIKKEYEAKIRKASNAGNFALFSQVRQDMREEFEND